MVSIKPNSSGTDVRAPLTQPDIRIFTGLCSLLMNLVLVLPKKFQNILLKITMAYFLTLGISVVPHLVSLAEVHTSGVLLETVGVWSNRPSLQPFVSCKLPTCLQKCDCLTLGTALHAQSIVLKENSVLITSTWFVTQVRTTDHGSKGLKVHWPPLFQCSQGMLFDSTFSMCRLQNMSTV